MEVKTTDLYLSAYLISHQIHPSNIQKLKNNKKVMFIFPMSTTAQELVTNYNNGNAMSNITQYKNHLEYARDLLFSTLRSVRPTANN